MRRQVVALLTTIFITGLLSGAAAEIKANDSGEGKKIRLKVALFPYIPKSSEDNFSELERRMKQEFQAENPRIELELRPLNPDENFYKLDFLRSLLEGNPDSGKNAYHLVEVDSVLLGDLVDSGMLRPWSSRLPLQTFFPAARRAMRYHRRLYGFPHWLCGFFTFTHSREVAHANSTSQMVLALDHVSPPLHKITGNFVSSWDTPAMYLGAWVDKHGDSGVGGALQGPLDPAVLADLKKISDECRLGNKNPCTNRTYKDNDRAALEFAQGKSEATFGYSERLNLILRSTGDRNIYVAPLQLSDVRSPLFFVDVLVLNKQCTADCEDASRAFATYLNARKTNQWMLLSEDSQTNRIPRYLLPATFGPYESERIANDKYYRQFRKWSHAAPPLPQKGILTYGPCLRSKVLDYLGEAQSPSNCPAQPTRTAKPSK